MKALFIILFLVILAVSVGGVVFLTDALRKTDSYHIAPASPVTPRMTGGTQNSVPANAISVETPVKGQAVSSPLVVSGKAWGSWFFEGVFPVRLVDENGKEVVREQAHAQGEWTVSDFVPFTAELAFPPPFTKSGVLILEKDNPSGLPQNAQSVEIPVTFAF